MSMKKQTQKISAIILIVIGVIFFILIGGLSIWADLEASLFNSAKRSREPLPSLNCPSIISSDETGVVSASFSNPSDRIINPKIQTFISDGFVILMQEKVDILEIEPGETESIEIKVTAANAVYNRIILVRMHQFAYGPLPYRNASCGIFVINIPFLTGTQFIYLSMALGTLFSGAGIILWGLNSRPIVWDKLTNLKWIIAFVLLSILIAIIGLLSIWLLGVFLFVLWILLAIGLVSKAVLDSDKQTKNIGKKNK